jgi:hypothetical protein
VGPHLSFNDKNELVVGPPAKLSAGDATVDDREEAMEPKSVRRHPPAASVAGIAPLQGLKKGLRLNLNGLRRKAPAV